MTADQIGAVILMATPIVMGVWAWRTDPDRGGRRGREWLTVWLGLSDDADGRLKEER